MMAFPFTGIVYFLVSIGLFFFSFRLYQNYQVQKENIVAKFFFLTVALFALLCLFAGVGGIIFTFTQSQFIAKVLTLSSLILVIIATSFTAYLVFYIKFPKCNPWIGFSLVFALGILTFILTLIFPYKFTLKSMGGIEWGFHKIVYLSRFSLYLFSVFPLSIILLEKFKRTKNFYIRYKALGLGLVFLVAFIIVVIDFILEPFLQLEATLSEFVLGFLSIILFCVLYFTRQLEAPKRLFHEDKKYKDFVT